MNESLKKLNRIAQKKGRTIIGLMSGTSLDGLDIALCKITGSGEGTEVELKAFTAMEYPYNLRDELQGVAFIKQNDLQHITLLHTMLGRYFAKCIDQFLSNHKVVAKDIDLIASHGQTVYHAPFSEHNIPGRPNATLQLGEGDHIARMTGIITLSDFRQKEIAAGGEGAPLAGYAEEIWCKNLAPDAMWLNIGGISNVTVFVSDDDSMLTTDLGPGNTLIDKVTSRVYSGLSYDENGLIAARGSVNKYVLNELLNHPFFHQEFPKSTGQESFNLTYVKEAINRSDPGIKSEDLISTLTELTVQSIKQSVKPLMLLTGKNISDIIVSGGGVHNNELMKRLQDQLPDMEVKSSDVVGMNPDAKEAVLFAILANEAVCGTNFKGKDGKPLSLGKISLPV